MNANFMIIECNNKHRFRLGLTDDGYRDCPECGEYLKLPYFSTKEEVQGLVTIGQAWREKHKAESKSHRANYDAVAAYVKELETLLLHNGIPLPTMREDINLPTELEGDE